MKGERKLGVLLRVTLVGEFFPHYLLFLCLRNFSIFQIFLILFSK